MNRLLISLSIALALCSSIATMTNAHAHTDIDHPKVKWRFRTEGPIRGDAVIVQNRIYFGSADGKLYALDKQDGTLTWSVQTEGALTSAPRVTDDAVYFVSRDDKIYSVDVETGTSLWTYEMDPILPDNHAGWEYFMAEPVVTEHQLLVGSGDGTLYALHPDTGELLWQFETNGRIRAAPLVEDGVIYQPSNNGFIYAVDAADGSLLWQFETHGATYDPEAFSFDRSSIFTQPQIATNLLVFGSRDGNVYAVDLTTHEEAWSFAYGTTWAMSIAIADGTVYVGWSTNDLFSAIDLATGEEKWQFQSGSHVYTTPLVLESGVVIGSADGNLYKLDRPSGELLLEYALGSEIYSSPLYDAGVLFVGCDDGYYYALEDRPEAVMAVYEPEVIEGNAQYLIMDPQLTPYLTTRGFDQLDERELVHFVTDRITDGRPSVVVFALPLIPDTLMGDDPASGLMRQYLQAGGKIVWPGDVPNFYAMDASGQFTRDAAVGSALLDVAFSNPTESGNYFSNTTQTGRNWGLPAWLKTTASTIVPAPGIVPLAYDEYGRISMWMKSFHPRPGSRYVSARTSAWNVPMRDADLTVLYQLAMYGLE